MRFGKWEIVSKAAILEPVGANTHGWGWGGFPWVIREWDAGDWQKNKEVRPENIMMNAAVFSCVSLIAQDISKMPYRLMERDSDGIWEETTSSAYSPVLSQPNDFQNQMQFRESWMLSKLMRGNTYILKQRDARNVVVALYVLDPCLVKPLVSTNDDGTPGEVFYQLQCDNLAGIAEPGLIVPASEIIHDRWNTFWHPLCGLSPLYAAALPALLSLKGVRNSERFFGNAAMPSGILTAPGPITPEKAKAVAEFWRDNFTGANAGRVAIVGDGLKFDRVTGTNADAQLMDLLKWSAEQVAACFHVPPYKIGAGAAPAYANYEAGTQDYYQNALQVHVQAQEQLLTGGLNADPYQVNVDESVLLRMDTAAQVDSATKGIGGGLYTVNDGRKKVGLKALKGGDTVFLQQQMWSLEELAERAENGQPTGTTAAPAREARQGLAAPAPAEDDAAAKNWYAEAIAELNETLGTAA